MGLRAKLLVLLLGFGLIPVLAAAVIGSTVSRSTILSQAGAAMQSLASAQANHLATELGRERLLLRTIAGRLPAADQLERQASENLGSLLVQSLLDDGVFDGLRVVANDGRTVVSVALRNTQPHWPAAVPAADWERTGVVVHREGGEALAYLVAVPLGGRVQPYWLEGHVRQADFQRAFAIPEHLVDGVESVVFDRAGEPVFALHAHALQDVAAGMAPLVPGQPGVSQIRDGKISVLVATATVPTADWVFAAGLPVDLALAPLLRLRTAVLLGTAGLVLLILLTGILAARHVTTPVNSLVLAVRDLGRGGVPRVVATPSRDELGTLVQAFHGMAADLARSRLEIDALHSQELERAQQLATVGELASGVAHEIRNPLTGVRGALQLALRGLPAGETSRPLLEEALLQLARIETTTTRLLHYARPPELREVEVDANLLVDRAATIVQPKASNAGVELRVERVAELMPVRADPELLVQVLVNLLLNGIEAMSDGGLVTVWVARHAPEVWIGVRDTGPGIPEAQRNDIFRPFYTTKHQGTGLGLSIARQIVTRHGGSLRVEDTPEGGATFVIALPLALLASEGSA